MIKQIPKHALYYYNILKQYSTSTCFYKKEFKITPFCNVYINCPFNLKIRPLDVHSYPDCDRVIIKLFSNNLKTHANMRSIQNDNQNITLTGESKSEDNIDCHIETSIKSNLDITTTAYGEIDVQKFNGDKIILHTESGNIISDRCQSSTIKFTSNSGDINTLGTLHAAEIYLKTAKLGAINVNHLQGLKSNISSEDGDIRIKSSYCDETVINSISGGLILDNIHKQCDMNTKSGSLLMTGFDGDLNAFIENGDVDIQISKLHNLSKLQVGGNNNILLRLSEWVQTNTEMNVKCSNLNVKNSLNFIVNNTNNYTLLSPINNNSKSKFFVESALCNVTVESASWSDMLKLKGIHFCD